MYAHYYYYFGGGKKKGKKGFICCFSHHISCPMKNKQPPQHYKLNWVNIARLTVECMLHIAAVCGHELLEPANTGSPQRMLQDNAESPSVASSCRQASASSLIFTSFHILVDVKCEKLNNSSPKTVKDTKETTGKHTAH